MAEIIRQDQSIDQGVNSWFFKETSLEELLADARPLQSMEDLALDDLTPEEATSFLRAIEE